MSQSGKREPYGGGRTVTPAVTSLREEIWGCKEGDYKPGWGLQCNGKIRGGKK